MNTASPPIRTQTLIVGSGFSGLGMAMSLVRQGRRDFIILEKASSLGGTWRDNSYPGCACDVASHLYSFSFEPNSNWSRVFAPQTEILAYLQRCADKYSLQSHFRFSSEVVKAEYREALSEWWVTTQTGTVFCARYLVLGLGAFSRPATPNLSGMATFQGTVFHSAAWNHGHNLRGQKVAVVGTGASAIQLIPEVAKLAARVDVYQRTPAWVLPKPDAAVGPLLRHTFAKLPAVQRAYRYFIYAALESLCVGFSLHPKWMKLAAHIGKAHLRANISDAKLRQALTPNYLPGCKRILISNDFYQAMARPNVQLVTDSIDAVTPRGIRTRNGEERQVDTIIFATGFAITEPVMPIAVVGRNGTSLADTWRERVSAYLGCTVNGFPNLFMLMGPNTGLGNNSMVFMIEAQIRYALQCMKETERRGSKAGEVLLSPQQRFNQALQKRIKRSVWATGCQSWYLDKSGHNPTVWPGFTLEYWWQTRQLQPCHYRFDSPSKSSDAPTPQGRPSTTVRQE